MAYATYAEVIEWGTFSESQSVIEKMIDWASDMTDSLTGTKFASTAATDIFYGDGYNKKFLLNHTPVISITSVTDYDTDGDENDTYTVDYFQVDEGLVRITEEIPKNYRVNIIYQYGDTGNSDMAKLLTIYLTKLGVMMMKNNGGAFSDISMRMGDIAYSLRNDADSNALLMNAHSIIQSLKRITTYSIGRDGYYPRLK